jgi:hypothetical protein
MTKPNGGFREYANVWGGRGGGSVGLKLLLASYHYGCEAL